MSVDKNMDWFYFLELWNNINKYGCARTFILGYRVIWFLKTLYPDFHSDYINLQSDKKLAGIPASTYPYQTLFSFSVFMIVILTWVRWNIQKNFILTIKVKFMWKLRDLEIILKVNKIRKTNKSCFLSSTDPIYILYDYL